MKSLKLTILIEPERKAELINVLGTDYKIVGDRLKFIQYSFPAIKMLTIIKLLPIVQLLSTYEQSTSPLRFYMLHLKDDIDSSYAPVYFSCLRGVWSLVDSKTGNDIKSANSLSNLV